MDLDQAIEFRLEQQAKNDAQIAKNNQQIGQILEIANKLEGIVAGLLEHARIADGRLDALENGSDPPFVPVFAHCATPRSPWPTPSRFLASFSANGVTSHKSNSPTPTAAAHPD